MVAKTKHKVIYVGALMRRKYPVEVLLSLKDNLLNKDYSLVYIGEGALSSKIRKIVNREHLEKKVRLTGFVPREQVRQELSDSDLFSYFSFKSDHTPVKICSLSISPA